MLLTGAEAFWLNLRERRVNQTPAFSFYSSLEKAIAIFGAELEMDRGGESDSKAKQLLKTANSDCRIAARQPSL